MELGFILFVLAVIYYGIINPSAKPEKSEDPNRYDVLHGGDV